jgi:hypothetical protein
MPENNPPPAPDPTLPSRLQIEQLTEAAVTGALRALDARGRAAAGANPDLGVPDGAVNGALAGILWPPIVVGWISPYTIPPYTLPTFPGQVPDPPVKVDE